MRKLILVGLIGILITNLFADYNKGFKYFQKYIKRKTQYNATQFLEALEINSTDKLNNYFDKNTSKLFVVIEDLNISKKKKEKLIKSLKKLQKKHKIRDVKDFLKGILNGKIPAGCS